MCVCVLNLQMIRRKSGNFTKSPFLHPEKIRKNRDFASQQKLRPNARFVYSRSSSLCMYRREFSLRAFSLFEAAHLVRLCVLLLLATEVNSHPRSSFYISPIFRWLFAASVKCSRTHSNLIWGAFCVSRDLYTNTGTHSYFIDASNAPQLFDIETKAKVCWQSINHVESAWEELPTHNWYQVKENSFRIYILNGQILAYSALFYTHRTRKSNFRGICPLTTYAGMRSVITSATRSFTANVIRTRTHMDTACQT